MSHEQYVEALNKIIDTQKELINFLKKEVERLNKPIVHTSGYMNSGVISIPNNTPTYPLNPFIAITPIPTNPYVITCEQNSSGIPEYLVTSNSLLQEVQIKNASEMIPLNHPPSRSVLF